MKKQFIENLVEKRGDIYGDACRNFALEAEFINAILNHKQIKKIENYEIAIIMILHKISRILTGKYHKDNWVDIAGYANLGEKLQKKAK